MVESGFTSFNPKLCEEPVYEIVAGLEVRGYYAIRRGDEYFWCAEIPDFLDDAVVGSKVDSRWVASWDVFPVNEAGWKREGYKTAPHKGGREMSVA